MAISLFDNIQPHVALPLDNRYWALAYANLNDGIIHDGMPKYVRTGAEKGLYTYDAPNKVWVRLGAGTPGEPGQPGKGATIQLGTITYGEVPSITNVGTETDAIFNFVLPSQGPKGDPGPEGKSMWIAYANDAIGTGASFNIDDNKKFLSFYQSVEQPLITAFTQWIQFRSTTTAGSSNIVSRTKVGHLLKVGDIVDVNMNKALASTPSSSEVAGFVVEVVNADVFKIALPGSLVSIEGRLSGGVPLVVGTCYFLSTATAGDIQEADTTTIGTVSKPVLLTISATEGIFVNMRGLIIQAPPAASSGKNIYNINKLAHGFVAGDVINLNYEKALATDGATSEVIGIVHEVLDVDNFSIVTVGPVVSVAGKGYTTQTAYFLSETAAGGVQITDVTFGKVSKPILLTLSGTDAIMLDYRGMIKAPDNTGAPAFAREYLQNESYVRNEIVHKDQRIFVIKENHIAAPTPDYTSIYREIKNRLNEGKMAIASGGEMYPKTVTATSATSLNMGNVIFKGTSISIDAEVTFTLHMHADWRVNHEPWVVHVRRNAKGKVVFGDHFVNPPTDHPHVLGDVYYHFHSDGFGKMHYLGMESKPLPVFKKMVAGGTYYKDEAIYTGSRWFRVEASSVTVPSTSVAGDAALGFMRSGEIVNGGVFGGPWVIDPGPFKTPTPALGVSHFTNDHLEITLANGMLDPSTELVTVALQNNYAVPGEEYTLTVNKTTVGVNFYMWPEANFPDTPKHIDTRAGKVVYTWICESDGKYRLTSLLEFGVNKLPGSGGGASLGVENESVALTAGGTAINFLGEGVHAVHNASTNKYDATFLDTANVREILLSSTYRVNEFVWWQKRYWRVATFFTTPASWTNQFSDIYNYYTGGYLEPAGSLGGFSLTNADLVNSPGGIVSTLTHGHTSSWHVTTQNTSADAATVPREHTFNMARPVAGTFMHVVIEKLTAGVHIKFDASIKGAVNDLSGTAGKTNYLFFCDKDNVFHALGAQSNSSSSGTSLAVKDEGVALTAGGTALNFKGNSIVATHNATTNEYDIDVTHGHAAAEIDFGLGTYDWVWTSNGSGDEFWSPQLHGYIKGSFATSTDTIGKYLQIHCGLMPLTYIRYDLSVFGAGRLLPIWYPSGSKLVITLDNYSETAVTIDLPTATNNGTGEGAVLKTVSIPAKSSYTFEGFTHHDASVTIDNAVPAPWYWTIINKGVGVSDPDAGGSTGSFAILTGQPHDNALLSTALHRPVQVFFTDGKELHVFNWLGRYNVSRIELVPGTSGSYNMRTRTWSGTAWNPWVAHADLPALNTHLNGLSDTVQHQFEISSTVLNEVVLYIGRRKA